MRSRCLVALLLLVPVFATAPAAALPVLPASCIEQTSVDVVLVMDRSGSMTASSRMARTKDAAKDLLDTLLPTDQSALVSFASDVRMDRNLVTSHLATKNAVDALVPDGGTQIWKGIRMATYELTNHGPFDAGTPYSDRAGLYGGKPVMIVLSDGLQNQPTPDPAAEAAQAHAAGITVFSIALGDDIPAQGLQTLRDVASTDDHYFHVGDNEALDVVFLTISARLRDLESPTVSIARPAHDFYDNDVSQGASPLSLPLVRGLLRPAAVAADDCLLDRVEFRMDEFGDDGSLLGTRLLGVDTTAPFEAELNCHDYAGGRHVLRVTAVDFDAKRAHESLPFYCYRSAIDARGSALFARLTDPVGPNASEAGARLPTPYGGRDESVVLHRHAGAPVPFDASLLYDFVEGGGANGSYALSRVANLTLPTLPQRIELLESTATASLSGLSFAVGGDATTLEGQGALPLWLAPQPPCETAKADLVTNSYALQSCVGDVIVVGNAELRFAERIVESGEGFRSITVNALHVIVERSDARAELVLGQSYAAASYLGARGLAPGKPARSTDAHNDAGTRADAPDSAASALPLAPGLYQGRVADAQDVDAYAFQVAIGEKIHVALAPSHEAGLVLSDNAAVAPSARIVGVTARLLDPQGLQRDAKTSLAGEPVAVELNVDEPGTWVVLVSGRAMGDYTMRATVAPALWPAANDALLGIDAGASCQDAALVGPGAHVGAIEATDGADVYRFPLFEGQALAVTLRPGDTLEAADMDLVVYDPSCRVVAYGIPLPAPAKGAPENVVLGVRALGQAYLAPGMYRAEVRHKNGLGSYELVIETSIAAQPT